MNRPSLRKAAILVATLDARSADALLDQMSADQADRVRRAIMKLGDLDPDEQQQVIREFMGIGPLVPAADSAGIELDQTLAARLAAGPLRSPVDNDHRPQRHRADSRPAADHADRPPFRFLHEAAGDTLSQCLVREHPQTIAVVLAHLPPERAAEVVCHLPAPLQAEVLRRVADMDEMAPEILREVEAEIESRLASHVRTNRRRAAGMAAVSAIVGATELADRRAILKNLAATDADLAGRLGTPPAPASPAESPARRPAAGAHGVSANPVPMSFEFTDVEQLDDAQLAQLFSVADSQVTLLALTGARSSFVERLLAQLPADEAGLLDRSLKNPGPLRLADVAEAQRQLADLLERLVAAQRISAPAPHRFAAAA